MDRNNVTRFHTFQANLTGTVKAMTGQLCSAQAESFLFTACLSWSLSCSTTDELIYHNALRNPKPSLAPCLSPHDGGTHSQGKLMSVRQIGEKHPPGSESDKGSATTEKLTWSKWLDLQNYIDLTEILLWIFYTIEFTQICDLCTSVQIHL